MKYKLLQQMALLLLIPILFTACKGEPADVADVRRQLHQEQSRSSKLEKDLVKERETNKSLEIDLTAANALEEGGLGMGEREKKLVEKESRLKVLETELTKKAAELEVKERRIDDEGSRLVEDKNEFVESKQEGFERIGEAKQIDARYDDIVADKQAAIASADAANKQAHDFLTYIMGLGILVVFLAAATVIYVAKSRVEHKKIDSAMQVILTTDLSVQTKDQIAARLGKALPLRASGSFSGDDED